MNARERVQRLLDGRRTDIEETALHGITDGDRTLEGDIRELLDIAEAAEVVEVETPAPEARGEQLVRLLREHVTAAQVEAEDATALRALLVRVSDRLDRAEEVALAVHSAETQLWGEAHADERARKVADVWALAAQDARRIIAGGRVVHVSTEHDAVTDGLAFGGKSCAVAGCNHRATYQDSGSVDWCACHYGEPHDPAECNR